MMVTDYNAIPSLANIEENHPITLSFLDGLVPRSLYPRDNDVKSRMVDNLIFGQLCLTSKEQTEVYDEVEMLVMNRLKKAYSL